VHGQFVDYVIAMEEVFRARSVTTMTMPRTRFVSESP
jgi:hypothetical protein